MNRRSFLAGIAGILTGLPVLKRLANPPVAMAVAGFKVSPGVPSQRLFAHVTMNYGQSSNPFRLTQIRLQRRVNGKWEDVVSERAPYLVGEGLQSIIEPISSNR